MESLSKGLTKVEVALKWDPSPHGAPAMDLDLVAAVFTLQDPHGAPAYVVHFDHRAPDGTITLNRDSRTGQGLGFDEVMVLELNRLSEAYGRVAVAVVIQQNGGHRTFADVHEPGIRLREGYDELGPVDFTNLAGATGAVVAEFGRGEEGEWGYRPTVRGYDTELPDFLRLLGGKPEAG
ncbi:TerD family protein [Streptomyces sp. NPDC047046]|uniref:TerD family protein n=1 Tax=Streptomyces sp. NPDC047046 TaxID=3155378 RepID=UPI0033CE3E58